MKIIVGLGNPGREYEKTRHNLGFMVLDRLAELVKAGAFKESRFKAETAMAEHEGAKLLLAKPTTFMNLSGEAVGRLLAFYKRGGESLLVVHDDLDLPLARMKFAAEGSSGGHRGVDSIIEVLGTGSFPRLRLGIGHPPPGREANDHVLSPFTIDESGGVKEILNRSVEAVLFFAVHGIVKAMDQYNRRS